MAIRYDKKLNQEINRTIRNFNQKISRLEKEQRELFLPSKISKKELKEEVRSRTELRRKLKELQRFSKRGIEETITTKTGIKLSKYEFEELKREAARVKRNVSREISQLGKSNVKVAGKLQAATLAQMGSSDYLNRVARRKALEKDIFGLSREEFDRYRKLVKTTGKNKSYMDNVFKQNYMDMLTDLGYYTGYDNEKLQEIKTKLIALDSNKFLKLFYEDRSIKAILDYYPGITQNFTALRMEDIKDDVETLYNLLYENIDDILKDYA